MRTKNIVVPRHLIDYFFPHPEPDPYGEVMVMLKNGMYTDVFTDDNGDLYTPTNDVALTKYLRKNRKKK